MKKLTDLWYDDWGSPKKGKYPQPCQSIENLTYDYSEKSGFDSRATSRFMVLINFPNVKYREITHVQEYDIESFVGNVGGYIGLFLGYTLLHFPMFGVAIIVLVRRKLLPRVESTKTNIGSYANNERKKSAELQDKHELCLDSFNTKTNLTLNNIETQLTTMNQRICEVEEQISNIQGITQTSAYKSSIGICNVPRSLNKPYYIEK